MNRRIFGLFAAIVGLLVMSCLPVFSFEAEKTTATERLQLPVPELSIVAQLSRFGEGVVFDRQGRLFVSSPFDNAVLSISETGKPQVWANISLPNGHKVLADGTHVVLEQTEQGGAAVYLDASGEIVDRITFDE